MDPRVEGTFHDGLQDGLTPLQPLDLNAVDSVDDLVRAMSYTSFGGRKTGEAADALEAMVRDPDCAVVLTLSGAMTIAKQGLVITDMIDRGMVQAIVSTGALMTHGLVEGAGMSHFKNDPRRSDERNYREGYNRVYDTLELESNLDDVETILNAILDPMDPAEPLSSYLLHERIGAHLVDQEAGRGVLQSAFQHKVPVFVPAFSDSELGLDLALHNRTRRSNGRRPIVFDPFLDLEAFTYFACQAKTLGIFTIGGGVPRNWAQQVGPYVELMAARDMIQKPVTRRYKYAVRICPEPVHWGGLSGCTYTEGVSWGKFEPASDGGRHVEVPSDATIAWPLITRAVMERLDREPAPTRTSIPLPEPGTLWT